MKWPTRPLADIADVITKGTTPTTLGRPFTDEGINFIKAEALNGDSSLDRQGFSFIDQETHELLRRSILQEDDVLVTIAGAQIGKCGFVKPEHVPANTNQAVGIVRINTENAIPRFVYYFFKQPSTFSLVQSLGAQAAQPNLNLTRLKQINLPQPPRAEQLRIADILSPYDDLIENNRRRIELLEDAARQLYREWFVRLRFPGREHTRIINSVPEGWEEGQVGTLAKLQSGYAFKSKDWVQEGNPVIKIANIDRNMVDTTECEFVSNEVAEQARNFLLKQRDLLIAMTGATIGKIGIMPRTKKNCYLNQRVGIFRIQPEINPIPFLFTFFNTENAKQQVINFAAGAAQPNISPTQIESIKLLIPSKTLFTAFADTCEPLFSQRLVLIEQNEYLKAARDLLLPRLMSGEIAV